MNDLMQTVGVALMGMDPPLATDLSVAYRKTPTTVEGDTFPLIVVSPGPDRQEVFAAEPDEAYFAYYPVQVTFFRATAGTVSDREAVLMVRERIRRKLCHYAVLVPDGWDGPPDDVQYDGRPPFDKAAVPRGKDVSAQLFTYRVIEPLTE
jgi:hypothetical protein